ncbi:histidine kinase dimerization/phosphoacceptor domain -containing protein [Marispirochaeta sp.]|uniref:histidine kinase dimerization/phosphoacceptor domain -containing protein n=1 Tax=Marispirochaeta sp. TaxID=2038653 RepID=UPI0029C771F8|nr:histidine kinase dimerization/phosphoacceptor domain -containing protein [Marispirochaeta sp.]
MEKGNKPLLPFSRITKVYASSGRHIIVFAGFLLLTAAVFFSVYFEAKQYLYKQFYTDALRRTQVVRTLLNRPLVYMNTIRLFFSSSEEVTPQEFLRFTREWIDQGIFLLTGWIPSAESGDTRGGYSISSGLQVSENGSPPGSKEDFKRALDSGSSVMADPVFVDDEKSPLILVHMPVSPSEGVIYTQFDLNSLLYSTISRAPRIGLSFQIVEETDGKERVLYKYNDQADESQGAGMLVFFGRHLQSSTRFAFADKTWRVDVEATPEYIRNTASNMPLLVLISGIVISLLLSIYLYQRSVGKQAFLEKVNELDRFFTLTLDLFCITSLEGTLIRVNPQWEKTLGYTAGTLEGTNYLDLVHPEDIQSTLDIIKQLTKGDEANGFTNRYRCADGSYRWIEWRSTASENLIYAAARDITERQQWEKKLVDSLHEKEILMKEIHHRVKNNLQIVKSMLNLEKEKSGNPFIRRVLERNQNRITAIALIHEILYTSDSMTRIDFSRHIRELLSLYIQTQDGRNINYSLDMSPISLPLDIAMPCGLIINEIVTNSIQHALDHVQKPKITLNFFRVSASDEGCIEISDNGPGFTLPDSTDVPAGLGLQMITALTEQIHGSLEFSGTGGSFFRIRFPIPDSV